MNISLTPVINLDLEYGNSPDQITVKDNILYIYI